MLRCHLPRQLASAAGFHFSNILFLIEPTSSLPEHAALVGCGSIASVERSRHVGFTPDSGRMAATQLNDASGQDRTHALQQNRGDLTGQFCPWTTLAGGYWVVRSPDLMRDAPARGRTILNSVKSLGLVSTSMDPPCCLTMMS